MKQNKHWKVLTVCCGLAAASIGVSINSSGVFYTPVSESLGIMRGTFAMHMTIFSIVTAIMALFVPKLMQMFSYKKILITSVTVAVLSTAAMALSKSVTMFYILGALRGMSSGLFSIMPLTMIINQWFHKSHGFATSLAFGFSGIAGAICSPILTMVIESYGWQAGYVMKALIILGLCLPAILYRFEIDPQKENLQAYGFEGIQEKTAEESSKSFSLLTIGFICFFVFALINTAISGITQHLPGFASSIGMTSTIGAMLLSAGMVGNIVSKLIIGVMSDKFGIIKATLTMMIVNVLGIVIIMTSSLPGFMIVGAFLFGSTYSIGAVGVPLLTRHFFGQENYTKAFPSISFASNVGSAISLTLAGYIYDFTGSYIPAFVMCLIINMVCFGLIFIVKYIQTKKIQVIVETI